MNNLWKHEHCLEVQSTSPGRVVSLNHSNIGVQEVSSYLTNDPKYIVVTQNMLSWLSKVTTY